MTDRSRAPLCKDFEIRLLTCLRELQDLMPELDRRYGMQVVLYAMAEHVGRGLHILRSRNICDDAQARSLIGRITATAFPRGAGQIPSRH